MGRDEEHPRQTPSARREKWISPLEKLAATPPGFTSVRTTRPLHTLTGMHSVPNPSPQHEAKADDTGAAHGLEYQGVLTTPEASGRAVRSDPDVAVHACRVLHRPHGEGVHTDMCVHKPCRAVRLVSPGPLQCRVSRLARGTLVWSTKARSRGVRPGPRQLPGWCSTREAVWQVPMRGDHPACNRAQATTLHCWAMQPTMRKLAAIRPNSGCLDLSRSAFAFRCPGPATWRRRDEGPTLNPKP